MHRSINFDFDLHPLMMPQDRSESTLEPKYYGKLINQFPPDIIKSMRRLEKNVYPNDIYIV